MNDAHPELSVIIVSYNVSDLVIDCIESIIRYESKLNYEIIVFDNCSSDDTVEKVIDLFGDLENFRLIKSKENIGFSAGNNRALQKANGDFLVFLNPDTILIERNTFYKQIKFMACDPKAGICAPKILFGNKKLQLSCGKKPTLSTIFLDIFSLPNVFKKHKYSDWDYNQIREVDWVSGACLLIRSSIAKQIGGFDENMTLYAEDVDLCLRTKDLGYTVVFNPNSALIHYGGQSTRKTRNTAVLAGYKSKVYFFFKHYGLKKAIILKSLFFLTSILKIMIFLPISLINKDYRSMLMSNYIALKKLSHYEIKKKF